jgi:hypothetical protein
MRRPHALLLPTLLSGLLLAGCKTAPLFPEPASALAGSWSNGAQYAAADPTLHRPPAAGTPYDWLDQQYATFRIVDAPALGGAGGTVVHVLWRSGSPKGPISRQRLWVFRPDPWSGQMRMHFLMLKDPEPFATAEPDSYLFRTLTASNVTSYPDACALPVRRTAKGFRAHILEICTITAQSGRRMQLQAEIEVKGATLTYSEAGRLFDDSYAFRVPNPGPYIFTREPPIPAR